MPVKNQNYLDIKLGGGSDCDDVIMETYIRNLEGVFKLGMSNDAERGE